MSALPFIAKSTTAERPSRLTWPASVSGERTSVTRPVASDGADHVADRGSPGRGEDVALTLDLDEHLLGGGALEPGALERAGGGGRFPSRVSAVVSSFGALPPIMAATSTNTSQPTIALARCRALQRPVLATIPMCCGPHGISPFSDLN